MRFPRAIWLDRSDTRIFERVFSDERIAGSFREITPARAPGHAKIWSIVEDDARRARAAARETVGAFDSRVISF